MPTRLTDHVLEIEGTVRLAPVAKHILYTKLKPTTSVDVDVNSLLIEGREIMIQNKKLRRENSHTEYIFSLYRSAYNIAIVA